MKLTPAPVKYDVAQQVQNQRELERADNLNRKKGAHVELAPGEQVILVAPNGTRYALAVSNVGALSTVAV